MKSCPFGRSYQAQSLTHKRLRRPTTDFLFQKQNSRFLLLRGTIDGLAEPRKWFPPPQIKDSQSRKRRGDRLSGEIGSGASMAKRVPGRFQVDNNPSPARGLASAPLLPASPLRKIGAGFSRATPAELLCERRTLMYRNRNLTLVLALAAGWLGGMLSRYNTMPSVHAEAQPTNAAEIRAQHFSVVDAQGRVIGTFTGAITKGLGALAYPRIALVDPTGRELWSASGDKLRPLGEGSK